MNLKFFFFEKKKINLHFEYILNLDDIHLHPHLIYIFNHKTLSNWGKFYCTIIEQCFTMFYNVTLFFVDKKIYKLLHQTDANSYQDSPT